MTSTENLWGEIPKTGTSPTPLAILRQQAGLLGESTNNLLVGKVKFLSRSDKFVLGLRIVAPALDNYQFEILTVVYPIELYPLVVTSSDNEPIRCEDESAFKAALKNILSSEQVHRVVDTLLSQSQAA